MNGDQIVGAGIIFGSYTAMLFLLYRSRRIIKSLKSERASLRRRMMKQKVHAVRGAVVRRRR